MRRIYSINYDLKRPGQNYSGLHAAIKNLGSSWWHFLDSCWLVDTTLNATQITARIRTQMDQNDYVLVVDIGRDFDGWLPEEAWEWVRTHRHAA